MPVCGNFVNGFNKISFIRRKLRNLYTFVPILPLLLLVFTWKSIRWVTIHFSLLHFSVKLSKPMWYSIFFIFVKSFKALIIFHTAINRWHLKLFESLQASFLFVHVHITLCDVVSFIRFLSQNHFSFSYGQLICGRRLQNIMFTATTVFFLYLKIIKIIIVLLITPFTLSSLYENELGRNSACAGIVEWKSIEIIENKLNRKQ